MREVKDELCGGLQEFSYTYSAGGFVAWAKETKDGDDVFDTLRKSTRYSIIRNAIDGTPFEATAESKLPQLRGPGWSVFSVDAWRVDEIGNQINPFCLDLLNSTVLRYYLNATAL